MNVAVVTLRRMVPLQSRAARRAAGYSAVGVLAAIILWQVAARAIENPTFREGFSPLGTCHALVVFVSSHAFVGHVLASLDRVGRGLLLASAVGIPLGLLVGYIRTLHLLTNTVFQFGRMTSPLAWMPIAVYIFGVGNQPVLFLIFAAALWPILINTANGVRNVELSWIRVVRMLGAGRWGVLRRAIIPAVLPDMLVGIRISLGVCWIVLVPAEMLGVTSGLGYYILDTRDRFNYSELMAVILVIGFFGFLSDSLLAALQRFLSWRDAGEEVAQ